MPKCIRSLLAYGSEGSNTRDDFFLKVTAAVRSADPAVLPAVLSGQRAHLLR